MTQQHTAFFKGTHTCILAGFLVLLMVLSRPYPMTAVVHLADATNAIFFLGGLMLLSNRLLPVLIALTVVLDYVSIRYFGTSAFCVSKAYVFQWPAFALLWMGGRSLAGSEGGLMQSGRIVLGFIVLQTLAFMLTSNSFYYLSGRFADPNFAELLERSARYYPGYLFAGLRYVVVALVALQLFRFLRRRGEGEVS